MPQDRSNKFEQLNYDNYYTTTGYRRDQIKQEHLNRIKQGLDVWNDWAKELKAHIQEGRANNYIIDLSETKFSKDISFDGFIFPCLVTFYQSFFDIDANFGKTVFSGDANFGKTVFSGDTNFGKAVFSGDTNFNKAAFSGNASFSKTAFSGSTSFREAAFSCNAYFSKAAFSYNAVFIKATFSCNVYFGKAAFSGSTSFREVVFSGHTSFTKVVFSGHAIFSKAVFSDSVSFHEAAFFSYAGFNRKVAFYGDVSFLKAKFSSDVSFREAAFSGSVRFHEAAFSGNVLFRDAKFSSFASFKKAMFSGDVSFRKVGFSGNANFNEAMFSGNANFSEVQFSAGSYFSSTVWGRKARFNAAQFTGNCSFDGSSFSCIPNYNFASFVQPPHIDGITVEEPKDKAEKGLVERYRKIKKMAIQSKDFENELKFYGLEMQSKAYLPTTSNPKRYFILAYQEFSDFGKSLARPIRALLVFLFAMSVINGSYMALANAVSKECREHKLKYVSAVIQYTFSEASPLFKLEPKRAIEIEICLFNKRALDIRNSLWRLVHLLPATLLLFLFGLAVRNKFKIG
jgi:hypothetical protein